MKLASLLCICLLFTLGCNIAHQGSTPAFQITDFNMTKERTNYKYLDNDSVSIKGRGTLRTTSPEYQKGLAYVFIKYKLSTDGSYSDTVVLVRDGVGEVEIYKSIQVPKVAADPEIPKIEWKPVGLMRLSEYSLSAEK